MKVLNNMWKFTDTNEDISNSLAYKCLKVAESGNYKEFKKMYKELSKQSFCADYLRCGRYRLQGYELNFTPFLKRFLIRYNGENNYNVVFAINKTNVFENMYINRSKINDIIEDIRHVVKI